MIQTPTLGTLRVYLDVGQGDPLASGVKVFTAPLEAHGVRPTFRRYTGGHNRTY